MSSMSMGQKYIPPKPPDRGSFPLDHFHECENEQNLYLQCLQRRGYDNFSCRYLSKEYLQCRMDKNLMKPESMDRLGFTVGGDNEELPARESTASTKKTKEEEGFDSSIKSVRAYSERGIIGRLVAGEKTWKLIKKKWNQD